jgi:chromosome segregation ATPase
MLLAEIATLSQKSSELEDKLALAHEEIDSLRQALLEKSEEFSNLQSSNERSLEEPQTKQQDSIGEKDDLQEPTASLESAEDIELLRTMTEALETSLKEANEQRRELEVTLATTRMELEIARGKIDALSNGRATAFVAVSTNPPSIDSRLQLYELEKENHALSRICEEKEKQLQEALMQCSQHEQMLETVSVQVLELQLQINELEEGKRELMKQSETQLDAANAYSTDLERRVNTLQCEILSLESERDGLHAQVKSQKAWIDNAASNHREMEDALEACRQELANTKHHGKDLPVEGMVDEPEEEPTFEKEVVDTSLVSENDVVDVELCTSRDGLPNEVVDGENTTPTQGKRTFKEILSFGRKALQLQTSNGKNASNP